MIRSLNIFVIEDYDALREAILTVLRQEGHQVVGAAMAEDVDDEAVGFIPDLYVIDLNLPGEDGISLARRVRRSQPDVGIIIASARTSIDDRVAGYQSGANVYLPKPIALEELKAVVQSLGTRLAEKASVADVSTTLNVLRMVFTGPSGQARLTQPELVLLGAFARAAQHSLEHWQVAQHLGGGEDISKDNLEVKLGRLRKKVIACGIPAPAIQVLRGHGYHLCFQLKVLR